MMVVQPVRSLSHHDIGYFVLDSRSRRAGLVDPADDRLVQDLLRTHDAKLEWVVATRNDEDFVRPLSRTAAANGAAVVLDGAFALGGHPFHIFPVRDLSHRMVRGPLALFPGRLIEAGELMDVSEALRRRARDEILSLLDPLPDRTRVYPARGPVTTLWLEKTFNSDFW